MEQIDNILKGRKINFNKLLKYGFEKKNDIYEYRIVLVKNEFDLIVNISKNDKIDAKVIDLLLDEEYVLVKVPEATGEYIGKIRKKYIEKITDIITNCSDIEIFKNEQTKQIIAYINKKYGNVPEFLWGEDEGNAIFRKNENNKWYAALLTTKKDRLGLDSDEIIEVIDLRNSPEEIEKIVDNEKYFLGYHMNKKHWFTIILDGSVELEKIFKFIDISYELK